MNSSKMKAVICTRYGTPEVLKIVLVDKPIPKSKEVLVNIIASSVNSGDVRIRGLAANWFLKIIMRLLFGFSKPRKPILGTVYAGIIEQIGEDVKDFKVGDEVYGLTGFNFGTHAEYISVKVNSVISTKPLNASFEEAAALLFGGQTACYFLNKTIIANVPNLNVMIYGATSSVGTSALQIAKYYQANVTAVCSDYNKETVLELGADTVIYYNKEDFTKTNMRFDIILDAVGKISKKQCTSLLKNGGKFLTVGGLEYATEKKQQLEFLKQLFENGKYKAMIDRIYSIDEIVDAHRYVDTGRKVGNVVIKIA